MIETVKVSSRGQVVIPENIRKGLNIKEGTKLVIIGKNKELIIKLEKNFLKELEDNKEKQGWLALAEKGMTKLWDNIKDDKEWTRYL